MKCQCLFSGKNEKKKNFKMMSVEIFTQSRNRIDFDPALANL